MSVSYFIRGTISVQVDGDKSKIWITPSAGFLTPDKQKAIAFPVLYSEDVTVDAKLINRFDDEQFKFEFEAEAEPIKANIPSLIVVAAQQKPIELRLDSSGLKITGFVFPIPSDHAQGR